MTQNIEMQPSPKAIILPANAQALFIEMWFNEQLLAVGTSFVVQVAQTPILITARHNVTGRDNNTNECLDKKYCAVPNQIVVCFRSSRSLNNWVSLKWDLYDEDSNPCWHEHPRLGARADFVGLHIPLSASDPEIQLYPVSLDSQIPYALRPADTVSVIGFPFGLSVGAKFPVWANGFVASEPELKVNDLPVFLIDCRSRKGQSGSPVFFHRNGGTIAYRDGSQGIFTGPVTRLLGVYSGRINEESDLGLVWKVSAVLELVNSMYAKEWRAPYQVSVKAPACDTSYLLGWASSATFINGDKSNAANRVDTNKDNNDRSQQNPADHNGPTDD